MKPDLGGSLAAQKKYVKRIYENILNSSHGNFTCQCRMLSGGKGRWDG